jgi:hypothetical protein
MTPTLTREDCQDLAKWGLEQVNNDSYYGSKIAKDWVYIPTEPELQRAVLKWWAEKHDTCVKTWIRLDCFGDGCVWPYAMSSLGEGSEVLCSHDYPTVLDALMALARKIKEEK